MQNFTANVIIMLLLLVFGFLVGIYVTSDSNNVGNVSPSVSCYPVVTTDYKFVKLPGSIVYLPPNDSSISTPDTTSVTLSFIASCDTVFADSTGTDSVSVTYSYPTNMFTVMKNSHRRTIVVEKTIDNTVVKNVSLWMNLDPTWGLNSFNVAGSFGMTYKHVMFGVVGNSNRELGVRIGFNY